jgi:hypothetical protein
MNGMQECRTGALREQKLGASTVPLPGVLHVHFFTVSVTKNLPTHLYLRQMPMQADARVHTMGMEEFPDHGTVMLWMLRTTGWGVSGWMPLIMTQWTPGYPHVVLSAWPMSLRRVLFYSPFRDYIFSQSFSHRRQKKKDNI